MKRSLKVLRRNPEKCMEAGDKCNSIFRTMREDRAWQNMRCGNWIPSQWYE